MDETEDTKALTNSQNEQEENPGRLWNSEIEDMLLYRTMEEWRKDKELFYRLVKEA